MLFIAYYTIGTPYEAEAEKLRATLKRFGLPHDISGVPNCGTWVRNCAYKPTFILDAMHKHNRALVYVDADARIRSYPIFDLPSDTDMAVHYRGGKELLSGTIYLGTTAGALGLVEAWRDACKIEPDVWDQKHLQRIIAKGSWRVEVLSAPYCLIYDSMSDEGPPVIEHTQASRRFKRCLSVRM